MSREFDGMDLFDDYKDPFLRDENRAKVMANVTELSTNAKGITRKGLVFLSGYFELIPREERGAVFKSYLSHLRARGLDAELVIQQAKK